MNDFYRLKAWGESYFSINELGHVEVRPNGKEGADLFELAKSLVAKGIEAPFVIRFNGIIRDRIVKLSRAFQEAISEAGYRNKHQIVFPLKVNPQKHVVDVILQADQQDRVGLEVGSKPELIAVLTLDANPECLLLCNGYKDTEYLTLAMTAKKLGRHSIIIIEQFYELKLVLETAEKLRVKPDIGFRMKLSSAGSGKWKSSGGEHSKFGLFADEIIACSEILKKEGKEDWLKLLHYHLGSQITAIESIKKNLKESVRMYTELAKFHPSLTYFDVGGGLAVDYDGSKTISDSSMDYTIEEYARDVVYAISEACLHAGINDPLIITECGRALVSHHAVFITEVIDVTPISLDIGPISSSEHEIIKSLVSLENELSERNARECFHDIKELKERILDEFIYGKLSLKDRAYAERKARSLFAKIKEIYLKNHLHVEELNELNTLLMETYFCNFSVFQSLPDSWAINQLFPIMPIHRLFERPSHAAVLADLTCDSDGKVDFFIGDPLPTHSLKLHTYTAEPYYLGIFLVGAYQEILGGLHNLFGDTNVVHAELSNDGKWELSHLVAGDTIEEALHYVQYNTENLMDQLHHILEQSTKAGRISEGELAQIKKLFKQSLESYTYLVI